jgi:8-oxo-dGTP pyrophosphatase MutT (NUDIX family)
MMTYEQSAVIPFRYTDTGELRILLITSNGGKWIVPKGLVEPDLSPEESAAQEAFEEAGVRGWVLPKAVGRYQYQKWGGTCDVTLFLFEVGEELKKWPEMAWRDRRWVEASEALRLVGRKELREVIARVPQLVRNARTYRSGPDDDEEEKEKETAHHKP